MSQFTQLAQQVLPIDKADAQKVIMVYKSANAYLSGRIPSTHPTDQDTRNKLTKAFELIASGNVNMDQMSWAQLEAVIDQGAPKKSNLLMYLGLAAVAYYFIFGRKSKK
jgi:hypothetical protein